MILCIETSTTNCSVALSKEGGCIAVKEENHAHFSHGESLHDFISDLLEQAGVLREDLTAVAVSAGPGSYTGLRIGVSAAKGLCFALSIPLLALSSLQILSKQVHSDGLIIPMLDARRMEVYTAVYQKDKEVEAPKPLILDIKSFEAYRNKEITFIGSGVAKWKELSLFTEATYLPDAVPSATEMCELVYSRYVNNQYEDVAYFEPLYLKAVKIN